MSDNTPTYAAGWYPDVTAPGTERYYDGAAWTAQTRPAMAPATAAAPTASEPVAKKPWFKRKAIVIPVGVVAGIVLISGVSNAVTGGSERTATVALETTTPEAVAEEAAIVDATVPDTTGLTAKEAQALIENAGLEVEFSADKGVVLDRDNWTVLASTPAAGTVVKSGDTVVVKVEKTAAAAAPEAAQPAQPAEPAKPEMTVAQSNAVRSAESYLDFKGFSRIGLSNQLTSEYGEGFAAEDAEFAIAYLESIGAVDWNAEAAESAKSYLDFKGFSRDGLYDQLTSEYGESFTPEQANFGLDAVGL